MGCQKTLEEVARVGVKKERMSRGGGRRKRKGKIREKKEMGGKKEKN